MTFNLKPEYQKGSCNHQGLSIWFWDDEGFLSYPLRMTSDLNLMTWISLGINIASRTIYLPLLKPFFRVTDITSFAKSLEKSKVILWTSVQRWCNIVSRICIERNHPPGLLRLSCILSKKGQRRSKFHRLGRENSEMLSTSGVWPRDHREDYRYCGWPFYSLVQIIP